MATVLGPTLDDAKLDYLDSFTMMRPKDIAVLALDGNADAVTLLTYFVERHVGVKLSENGVIEYWRALRSVEQAFLAANLPE